MPDLLDKIPGSVESIESLPHPTWDVVHEWIESNIQETGRNAAWCECVHAWLSRLSAALGSQYRTTQGVAARERLGCTIGTLAAGFLGPGEWDLAMPELQEDDPT